MKENPEHSNGGYMFCYMCTDQFIWIFGEVMMSHGVLAPNLLYPCLRIKSHEPLFQFRQAYDPDKDAPYN